MLHSFLLMISTLIVVFDEKKKPLFGQLKKYPEKLVIHCKDLRVLHFCLRYTKEEEVKRVTSRVFSGFPLGFPRGQGLARIS